MDKGKSDLIKREDAITAIDETPFIRRPILPHYIKAKIKQIPPAEEKQGEWIDKGWHGDWQFEIDGRGNCWKAFECSNCNTTSKAQTNFCPNCGARMKGADDEHDK